ncbi:MAG TPA: FadR/GntR family transcriptional regulator [Rectinemataceae bacterium]|nr:FadR/GntR family transcriptional regulator [Rectinemataceae bacterium]
MNEEHMADHDAPRRRKSLSGEVKRILSDRIAAGRYPIGSRLPSESEMIAEFNVSRTVIREAIANLKASGLAKTVQGSGAYVTRPERPAAFEIEEGVNLSAAQELVGIMELRIGLEVESVSLASRRRTEEQLTIMRETMRVFEVCLEKDDFSVESGERCAAADIAFHRAVSEATGNLHFLRLYNYLSEYMLSRSHMRSIKFGGGSAEEYIRRTVSEHAKIFHSIEARDSDSARAALYIHLAGSRDRLLNLIKPIASTDTPR